MALIKSKFKKKSSDDPAIGSDKPQSLAIAYNMQRTTKKAPKKMAHGGMAMEMPERAKSSVDAIMERRKAKKYAEGGFVDIEENGDEEPANPSTFDKMNRKAAEDETYFDDSQMDSEPTDSNEHADSEEAQEEDAYDMISDIRKKIRSRRGY